MRLLLLLILLSACAAGPQPYNCQEEMRMCMTEPGTTQIECNARVDACKTRNDALAGQGA